MDPTKIECSYLCVNCGYTTTSVNVENSELVKQYEESTAELIKALRWVDNQNLVWYPTVLNFPSAGIIFPDGIDADTWYWTAAPAVDIPEEERSKFPIPGSKDQFYTRRIDMGKGKKFKSDKFYDACKFLGFIKE
jgi:hypothetical protein